MEMALLVSFHTHKWFEMVNNSRNEHVYRILLLKMNVSVGRLDFLLKHGPPSWGHTFWQGNDP